MITKDAKRVAALVIPGRTVRDRTKLMRLELITDHLARTNKEESLLRLECAGFFSQIELFRKASTAGRKHSQFAALSAAFNPEEKNAAWVDRLAAVFNTEEKERQECIYKQRKKTMALNRRSTSQLYNDLLKCNDVDCYDKVYLTDGMWLYKDGSIDDE